MEGWALVEPVTLAYHEAEVETEHNNQQREVRTAVGARRCATAEVTLR
jgi:hypothetical protein